MIKYPNGIEYKKSIKKNKNVPHIVNAANRGMAFEEAINISNEYYVKNNIAVVYKRPTPINIVKVDYTKGAKIVDAYFEKQSTTDYNGVFKGKYLDFEAKSTRIKTSFPLNNISLHQIEHLERVIYHKGIAFFLIEFASLNEVYYLDAKYVIDFYKYGTRKSIPISEIKINGQQLKRGLMPPFNYLKILEKYI